MQDYIYKRPEGYDPKTGMVDRETRCDIVMRITKLKRRGRRRLVKSLKVKGDTGFGHRDHRTRRKKKVRDQVNDYKKRKQELKNQDIQK